MPRGIVVGTARRGLARARRMPPVRHSRAAPLGAAHRLGSAAVRQDRRAGRRPRGAAARAPASRLGRDASRSRGTAASRPARSSTRSPSPSAATRATPASTRRRWPTARARCSSTVPTSTIATGLYGVDNTDYPDNARRFAFLARAALEYAARRGAAPSIVHAHDWQAGLAPVYLRTLYASHPVLGGTPSVFTIHNLAYQGLFEPDWLPRLDLGWDQFAIDRLEFYGRISFLKGGINDADVDHDRQPPLRARRSRRRRSASASTASCARAPADLVGILNGIDTSEWDPAHDPFLPRAVRRRRSRRASARRRRRVLGALRPAGGRRRRWRGRSSGWCRGWSIRRASI